MKSLNFHLPLLVVSLLWQSNYACLNPKNILDFTCSARYNDTAAQTIQSLYDTIATADCQLADPCDYPKNYCPKNGDKFDFIIVGAGSAGCTLANRLTEVSNWNVLLVDAGGDPPKTSEVPAFLGYLQQTEVDWQYQTAPDNNTCLGMNDNRCNWPRGKVLGGSSTINDMVYGRGNRRDFDKWAEDGNEGWAYDDVLEYFKKSEDMRIPEVLATPESSRYHSTGGYMKVETFAADPWKPLAKAFAEGMEQLGYPTNFDYNGGNQSGFARFQATLEGGKRCSTAKAFLRPIKGRKNLFVSKESFVLKVLIDKVLNITYGIRLKKKDGQIIEVNASKEVIVSAGAINSPQLLMLSGIGPQEHLEKFNITVIKNSSVGENLQDQPFLIGQVCSVNYSLPSTTPVESMFQFLTKNDSALSSLGLASNGGFISVKSDKEYPDIELYLQDFNKSNAGLLALLTLFNLRSEIIDKYVALNNDSYIVIVIGSLLRPDSRGKILLKSADPTVYPDIISGYFSDDRDMETCLKYYDFVSSLVETDGLKSVNATLTEIDVPGCSNFTFASTEYRKCALKHLTTTTYHCGCSCKMGPSNASDSVVDPYLKVIGVDNLRVVDASIMPTMLSGNLNACVIMIAEKAADEIKKKWN